MDKYEYRVKTEQMLEYMEKKQYKKAMEIADTIDWRRVKNASMLNSVSEIYEYNGENQKSRDVLFLAYDRAPESRKIVYRLGTLALKINDTEEATDCYEEFVKLAPKDPNQYILKYKILRARRAPIADQIHALEDFKRAEYVEKWAYELARLYHEAGMSAECLEECDDLILWFSEGKYVYQAMELKMQYKPLTPLQQEKYDNRFKDEEFMGKQIVPEEIEETNDSEETAGADEEPQEEAVVEVDEKPKKKGSAKEALEKVLRRSDAQTNELDVQAIIEEALPMGKEESEEETETEETEAVETEVKNAETEAESEPEPEVEKKVREESPIRKAVKGATLAEALKNGVALANGLDIEEKASRKRDEELRITGQMKIEEILQEWEAKQKENAEAIKTQKQKDEERLAQKRREAERRREEEARRIEEQQRAAEEARRIAEQKAAEEARRIAIRKAEEERILAEQRAEEERRLAAEKAAEEERLLERMAAGKVTKELEEAIRRKPKTEEEPEDEDDYELEEEIEEEIDDEDDYELEDEVEEETDDEDDYESEDEVEDETDDEDDYELEDEVEDEIDDEDDYELEEEVEKEDKKNDSFGMTADLLQLMKEMEQSDAGRKDNISVDIQLDEDNFNLEDDFDEDDYDEDDYDEDDFDEVDEDDEDDYDEDDFDDYENDDEDDEDDFDEIEFEEEEEEKEKEELVIEEPTEEEIQKRIKKGKAGVPFDTGFVVTGRYDLSATSEIGLKAGLTEEQKKLFSYFVPVRGMSEQIVEVLDNDRREKREGTSRTGNILVIGQKGSGKTVLAVDIVKAIQRQRNLRQGKVAIITGESLNKKELTNIIKKLRGGAIIIEKAGKLNSRTVKELNHLMEKKTGELLFVLEDQTKPLEKLFIANPEFKKKFTSRLELPVFINDELVTFGQTYAKENGYKLDEMGILALYSRIDVLQREDHAVTVAEVKEIMDAAIQHSQKANVKHLARRMFGKSTDSSDRIILKEEDFRI